VDATFMLLGRNAAWLLLIMKLGPAGRHGTGHSRR